jgi:hypothetical protein
MRLTVSMHRIDSASQQSRRLKEDFRKVASSFSGTERSHYPGNHFPMALSSSGCQVASSQHPVKHKNLRHKILGRYDIIVNHCCFMP